MRTLTGQTAIVVGSAGIVGSTVIDALVNEGAHVIIAGPDEKIGQSQAKVLSLIGHQVGFVKVDISKECDVKNLMNETEKRFGKLDIFVSCFEQRPLKSMIEMCVKDWEHSLQQTFTGSFVLIHSAIKEMLKHDKGRIVSIGHGVFINRINQSAVYSAQKAFTEALGRELSETGITINHLSIENVGTQLSKCDESNNKKFVQPHEIADAMSFLLSTSAQQITGTTIAIGKTP